jgi:hypothetical protein
MKTTLDICDPLLKEARRLAARENTTLRALVEQGLRKVMSEMQQSKAFRLRKASFRGQGLRPEMRDVSSDRPRDLAYEGRDS